MSASIIILRSSPTDEDAISKLNWMRATGALPDTERSRLIRSMPARASTKPQLPASLILDARELIAIWRARDPAEWSRSPERYRLLGEKVLRAGEPLLAYDLVSEGLGQFPGDVRLRQLQGLALARSGANTRASEVLAQLRREKHADEETLGMLARTYKDGADRAASAPARRALLQRAADTYEEAYRLSRGIWTGINAATPRF